MTYTKKEFENLTEKHGSYGSWAIWEYSKKRNEEKSVKCIYENLNALNNKYIIIGLNISSPVEIWANFRGGPHDRKLKYAFNDSTLKGSYMTDLFKNVVNKKSTDFYRYIKQKPKLIKENIKRFKNEMKDLKVTPKTTFIVLGTEKSVTGKLFRDNFQQHFKNYKVIYHRHYSDFSWTDKEWVESIWKTLGIKANFDEIKSRYN